MDGRGVTWGKVWAWVGGGVAVYMYVDGREGLMVFGRHCVRFLMFIKKIKKMYKQQARQQSIQNVRKRNNVTMAMQRGDSR